MCEHLNECEHLEVEYCIDCAAAVCLDCDKVWKEVVKEDDGIVPWTNGTTIICSC